MAVADLPKIYFDAGYYGMIGLGSRLGEAVNNGPNSPGHGNPNSTFLTLYDQLQTLGYTTRRAFSIWQNSISATTGRIIFGGIDTSKFHGPLKTVSVELEGGQFFDWRVALTSITHCSSSHGHSQKETLTVPNANFSVVLDSGSPNMYLPMALAQNISSAMNATTQNGFPYVECAQGKVDGSFEFGLGGTTGPKIKVPYSALIYPFGAPSNIGPVTASDGTRLCYLGVIGLDASFGLLGDTFIRSAYVVYDVDNLQIAMAQARCDVDDEHVVELEAGTSLPTGRE